MRPALLAALLFCLAAPAGAFLFGGGSNQKAAAMLAGMKASFNRGDCDSVLAASDSFLNEKPAAVLREEAYRYVGMCYEKDGLTDKAIGTYKLALGLYPERTFFAYRLALIYNRAGFPENAVPLFLKALDLKSDDIETNLGLARAYTSLGFLARAKIFYSRAVVLQDFSDTAVLREYAFCMLKKRDWPEALYLAGQGSARAPGSASWRLVEARVMAGKGDYYKALFAIEAALQLEPSRQLRLERALYLLLAGLPRRAIDAADSELAADRRDALAAEVKGMALYLLGRKPEACAYFNTARGGGPFTAAVANSFINEKAGAVCGQ